MVRAFFAVDLDSPKIKKKILEIQNKLTESQGRIAFVTPENLHLTLKFLGEIDETLVATLADQCKKIKKTKFVLELQGLGALPNLNYINAIYVNVTKGQTELTELFNEIEKVCIKQGLKAEDRPFKSHLTIGRVKQIGNKQELVSKITSYATEPFGTFEVTQFVLKKSVLGPAGPHYTTLFEISLQ